VGTIASGGSGVSSRTGLGGFAILVAILALLPADRIRAAADKGKPPAVLVPPFENQSHCHEMIGYEVGTGTDPDRPKRRFNVDRYTEAPRSMLEDILVQVPGIRVVERQRVDALLLESGFGTKSGLVDENSAMRLGKMLGASRIVMGTILDFHEERKVFRGYGIETVNIEVTCSMRVRLLDETGTVKFSKVVKGSKKFSGDTFGGTVSVGRNAQDGGRNAPPNERTFPAVEETLKLLADDEQFLAAVRGDGKANAGAAGDRVEVEFAPQPENCDIEVDGKYVGGSPKKLALPAGKEVKVRIKKGGYDPWESVIVPERGLRITPELDRRR
jgi:hypothetical protein